MITFKEYQRLDGLALAQEIKAGNLQSSDVIECAISRLEQVNPKINAVVAKYFDLALSRAASNCLDGDFAGVPILLKDLLGSLKGCHTGSGSLAYKNEVADHTSTLYQRYSDMGLIFLGKTNTPELGLLATTEPVANGPSRNPWNVNKTTGGSSGGSAAAVAAGITPIASAGDGGGSIRIPASCCGLFGLKPSRGINPLGPLAESWDGAVSEHVITRSVRDSLAALKGSAGTDAYSHVPGILPSDFFVAAEQPIDRPLKIGFYQHSFYGGCVDKSCKDAVLAVVKLLRDLDHEVEEIELELDADKLISCYSDIYAANVNAEVADLVKRYGKAFVRSHVEPLTYFIYLIGNRFSAGEYILSKRRWAELSKLMDSFHDQHDVLLTPTMATPPFDLGTMTNSPVEKLLMNAANKAGVSQYASRELLYQFSKPQLQKVPFTQLANLTGQPAMSVPLYWNHEGLPVGVQFVARRMQDPLLFRLAAQLEIAKPWFDKVPDL